MTPVLFTSQTCSKCPAMKDWLANKGIKYDLVDITDDMNLIKPAYEISNMLTVPQLKIGDQVVVGLDFGKAASLLI